MQDFVDNIENIDISYHHLSAIDEFFWRKYASIIPQRDYTLLLEKSLGTCFEELAKRADQEGSTQRLTDMLKKILQFAQYMKVYIHDNEIANVG